MSSPEGLDYDKIMNSPEGLDYEMVYDFFRRSAQRFFIISEIRLRASGDIFRRRRLRPLLGAALLPLPSCEAVFREVPRGSRALSVLACAVSDARRSRVAPISLSMPPSAHPMSSADFMSTSSVVFLGLPRGIPSLQWSIGPVVNEQYLYQ